MSKVLFDIYILSSDGKPLELTEFENLRKEEKISILDHPKGLFCHARFRYGKMRCWVYHEYLMLIMRSCLNSIPFVFDGKYYFTWSEWNEKFNVVFQKYDKENIMVYVADNDTYDSEHFTLNEKYNIVMRPLVVTKDWSIKIPNTHKIAIMPKQEFYKIAYEKALYIKKIFSDIGYEKKFYACEEPLEQAKELLSNLNII